MKLLVGTRARAASAFLAALGLAAAAAGPAAAASAPTTPTELFNAYQYCSTDPNAPTYVSSLGGLEVEGLAQDADTSDFQFTMQYQLWPVSDPTQITSLSNAYANPGFESGVNVPQADLLDGQVYAWQAQAVGSAGSSGWSSTCFIAIDNTRPDAVPTISSANYPAWQQDPAGTPIQITLGSNGVGDVAGYQFSWNESMSVVGSDIGQYGIPVPENPWNVQPGVNFNGDDGFVKAPTLGGPVTVDLIPPQDSGLVILTAESLDRADNPSGTTNYWIFLKPDAPTVTLQGNEPKLGVQTPYLLTPDPGIEAASPVTSYQVVEENDTGQQELTIPADSNGDATLHVTDDSAWGVSFQVASVSANGWVSQGQSSSIDASPAITSDVYPGWGMGGGAGVSGTFAFSSPVKGIASFIYTINGGPATTVHAANGQAQIVFTPPASGWYDLEVTAVAKDGTQLFPNDYYFGVN